MPIGIVNPDDYKKEVVDKPVIDKKTPYQEKVPAPIRALIAQEVMLGGTVRDVAKELGVQKSAAHAYSNNLTTTRIGFGSNEDLERRNNIFRNRIRTKAGRLSLTALDSIAPEDFMKATLRDKSSVAKEMASIVRDMTPDVNRNGGMTNNVQFIIHAPEVKREEDYIDVIVSND
jgi:hypothetical protein